MFQISACCWTMIKAVDCILTLAIKDVIPMYLTYQHTNRSVFSLHSVGSSCGKVEGEEGLCQFFPHILPKFHRPAVG